MLKHVKFDSYLEDRYKLHFKFLQREKYIYIYAILYTYCNRAVFTFLCSSSSKTTQIMGFHSRTDHSTQTDVRI